MNKTLITIPVLLLILFSHVSTYTMTIDYFLENKDIEPQIINRIPQQDFPDMRLVCKKWAARKIDGTLDPDWKFMPDSVEKHYDQIIQQRNKFESVHKTTILFRLINDFDAVKWIVNRYPGHTEIDIQNKWITGTLSAPMLAIHYNKPEIARFLIEANTNNKDQHWKTVYKELTVSKSIEDCLYPGESRNFSFIPYCVAAWFDDAHNLKKFYKDKIPTPLGQTLLINSCLLGNSINCFNFLLKHKITKTIIKENNTLFFQITIDLNFPDLAKKLLKKKLYPINGTVNKETTLLDFYYHNETYKNDTQTHALLISLGAKTWKDCQKTVYHRSGGPHHL